MDISYSPSAAPGPDQAQRLSYKFQRLRERIRAAIAAGDLAGKLPGERSLAKQFNVNAKTLSKALTDLAAEGVLERNIGLGTFVRDASVTPTAPRILLLAPADGGGLLAAALVVRGLEVQAVVPDGDLLPSMLAPFDLVLVASPDVADGALRDMIVRGKTVVTVDRMPRPYSAHALMPHTARAAASAARHLVALGHTRLMLIPDDPVDGECDDDGDDVRRAVASALPDTAIRTTALVDLATVARDGFTGIVCANRVAARAIETCAASGLTVPASLAFIAYGRLAGEPVCCGYFVTDAMIADAVVDLLAGGLPHRPLTLWLASENIDCGTAVPPAARTAVATARPL